MAIIDPDRPEHARLIELQCAVNVAFVELDGWALEVGKPGRDWTPEENARAEQLREAARQVTSAKEAALYGSGLVEEYGYFATAQALKDTAKTAG